MLDLVASNKMGDAKGLDDRFFQQNTEPEKTDDIPNRNDATAEDSLMEQQEQLPLKLMTNQDHDSDATQTSPAQDTILDATMESQKIVSTIFVCSAFLGTGLCFGIWGPALLDLAELVGVTYDKMSLVFTTRSLGGLLVMFILARLYDIFNPFILYIGALLVTVTMGIYIPFSANFPVLLVVSTLFGASLAMVLNGGSTVMIRLWKQKAGPVLQSIFLCFICGTMVAPQIVRPFLSEPKRYNLSVENNTRSDVQLDHFNNDSVYFNAISLVNVSNSGTPFHATNQTRPVSRVHYAFIIVACYELLLLIFALILLAFDSCKVRIHKSCSSNNVKQNELSGWFKYVIIFIFAMAIFLVVGADLNYGALILTFSVEHLKWSKSQGTVITSVYYGAQVLGRAAAIPVTKFVKPQYYVSVNLVLALVSVVITAVFVHTNSIVIWVMCVMYGITTTGLYPAMIQWLNTFIIVNGRINGLVTAGIPLGFMVFPAISGWMLRTYDPMWFLYTQLIGLIGSCLLLALIFCCLKFYVNQKPNGQNTSVDIINLKDEDCMRMKDHAVDI